MSNLIQVKDLTKKFGSFTAVDNISFSVKKGEVLGFLGPNGVGKTTTMRMITGYMGPTSGEAIICGENILINPCAAKSKIGYLPEGGPLYTDMTVKSFLNFIGKIRQLEPTKLKERLDFVVDQLHLSEIFYQNIDTLSKGFKRRVALAQAILHDPEVLIMDEPTDGLDPNQKFEVHNLIARMAENKAIIISTHILEEVDALCARIIIIESGKIVTTGTPEQVVANAPEGNLVYLKVKGKKLPEISDKIMAIKQVLDVKARGDNSIVIYYKGDKVIIEEISKLAAKNKWKIEELYSNPKNLGEAFRAITSSTKVS